MLSIVTSGFPVKSSWVEDGQIAAVQGPGKAVDPPARRLVVRRRISMSYDLVMCPLEGLGRVMLVGSMQVLLSDRGTGVL